MIGIDTNTLLRLLLKDDGPQFRRSVAALRSISVDQPAVINVVVLVEAVWVMSKVKRLPKQVIGGLIRDLLDQDDLAIMAREAVQRSLDGWLGGKADFADYLIGEINRSLGCVTTLTFDRDAASHSSFTYIN